MRQGENLVRYTYCTARPVVGALASVEGRCARLRTFDPDDTSNPWKTCVADAPASANDLAKTELD